MARRFSDINRGPLLAEAHQRRMAYLSRTIAERNATSRVGQRTSSPTVWLVVEPFGEQLAAEIEGYLVRTTLRNRQAVSEYVGLRAKPPATDTAIKNGAFLPSQIRVFRQSSSRVARSAITGLQYNQRVGESFSHPFGQTGTEREFEAYRAIMNAAIDANPMHKVSYRAEKIRAS